MAGVAGVEEDVPEEVGAEREGVVGWVEGVWLARPTGERGALLSSCFF